MFGPSILVRTLSKRAHPDRYGNPWQYHSRSDHHSKVACWGIVFDLMLECSLLRRHVESGAVTFGINHEMRDFKQNRKKDLDLVICTPSNVGRAKRRRSLASMVKTYEIALSPQEESALSTLPLLKETAVGSVLMALEAKACMTAHQKALPRFYDELNSSQLTVHGASEQAIAAGFVMVNISDRFLSPVLNNENRRTDPKFTSHDQPKAVRLAIEKVGQIPLRARTDDQGYDAFAVVVVDCVNDGSPVRLVDAPPAPRPGDNFHYASFISRLSATYSTRFKEI